MADAKRIRKATFNTAKVTGKLVKVKRQAWTIVAKELDVLVHDKIKKPVGVRRGKKGGVIKIRSKPGEPPRKDSGFLFDNTSVRYDAKSSRVVMRTPNYGRWLHTGTRRIQPRPWANVVFTRQGNLRKEHRKRATQVMKTLAGR